MAYDPSTSQEFFNNNVSQNEEPSSSVLDTDETEEAEYLGSSELPEASIIAMAQSVGVNLTEDVANALAELTVRKLRYATLLAMQFSAHENSCGLRVSDFSKAEFEMNSPTYGHKSSLPSPEIKPIGLAKISLWDEGPEIDLLATINSSKVGEITIKDLDPTFHVHHAFYNNKLLEENESGIESFDSTAADEISNLDVAEIPLLQNYENSDDDENSDELSSPEEEEDNNALIQNDTTALELFNHVNESSDQNPDEEGNNESSYQLKISSNCLDPIVENHVDKIVENGPNNPLKNNDNDEDEEDEEMELELNEVTDLVVDDEGVSLIDTQQDSKWEFIEQAELDIEWLSYLKTFVTCFLNNIDENEFPTEDDLEEEDDFDDEGFQRILDDVKKHGAYPVLDVICDFFRDYIRGLFVSVSSIGLQRIVSVINAFILSPSTPSIPQMRKMSSVLIEIFILPSPCIIQRHLTQIFMKILKIYDELLTWTCTYITEVLKKTTEVPLENLSDSYKYVLHGALCLTNGLEMLNIQVAQEFGWHASILSFSRKHNDSFLLVDTAVYSEADGYLEEEILRFCRNILVNYKGLIPAIEMNRIHNSVKDIYGEKLVPYLCNTSNFTSSKKCIIRSKRHSLMSPNKKKTVNNSISRNTLIIRKGYWKNRKISIPYKSFLSSSV